MIFLPEKYDWHIVSGKNKHIISLEKSLRSQVREVAYTLSYLMAIMPKAFQS